MAAYKIRLVKLDDCGEVQVVGKRTKTFITPQPLKLGGLYFLERNKLYRVEREL